MSHRLPSTERFPSVSSAPTELSGAGRSVASLSVIARSQCRRERSSGMTLGLAAVVPERMEDGVSAGFLEILFGKDH